MSKTPPAMPALLTYEDYCQIPNDGNRYEVIDGVLYMSPSPKFKHQRISIKIAASLFTFVEEHKLGVVLEAPFDIILSETDVVIPDILFISNERASIITEKNAQGAPDLLIEILSESNRRHDEIVKRKLYEKHGVLEYWVVDPLLELIKVYRLEEGAFKKVTEWTAESADVIDSPLLPGFRLPLNQVFVNG